MNTIELIKQLLKRLKKLSWLIVVIGLILGGVFYYMAKQSVPVYTSKATVYPLNSSTDNNITGSAIGNILGLADAPKSFSGEASINIVELATSRRTREAVAETRVPSLNNKTVAQLLMEESQKQNGEKPNVKLDSATLINIASNILRGGFVAKINKNGILELYYSSTSQDLVKAINYVFIDRISSFYIDLKKKKAQIDYQFAVNKTDSLNRVLDSIDNYAIHLDETTFFTNDELKRFNIPKFNLEQDKQTVQSQYYYAVNNRESAAYKLQKETPIIEILDKPEGPYDVEQKSTKLYAIIGFLLGLLVGIILVSWKIISKFLGAELNKAIEKATKAKEEQPLPVVPAETKP